MSPGVSGSFMLLQPGYLRYVQSLDVSCKPFQLETLLKASPKFRTPHFPFLCSNVFNIFTSAHFLCSLLFQALYFRLEVPSIFSFNAFAISSRASFGAVTAP